MPVILPEEAEAAWINLEVDSPEELTPFIRPFPAASMESNEVSTQVNSPRNDRPELLTPGSGQLF
jgi:putative SOS response-associated peptidase YedK